MVSLATLFFPDYHKVDAPEQVGANQVISHKTPTRVEAVSHQAVQETRNLPISSIEFLLANPEILREIDDESDEKRDLTLNALFDFFRTKDYNHYLIDNLAKDGSLSLLIQGLLLKAPTIPMKEGTEGVSEIVEVDNLILDVLDGSLQLSDNCKFSNYIASREQNKHIDRTIRDSCKLNPEQNNQYEERKANGIGSARLWPFNNIRWFFSTIIGNRPNPIRDTKVIIIGAGPSGLMTTRMLIEMGFKKENITVLDKSGKYKGIWKKSALKNRFINNPFDINFLDVKLPKAPQPGQALIDFLDKLIKFKANTTQNLKLPKPIQAKVVGVIPGDLDHQVGYIDENKKEQAISAPIVINCLGTGAPRKIDTVKKSDRGKAPRWMRLIDDPRVAKKLIGKTVVINGLGNSAIEMVAQLQKLNRDGYNITYKVLAQFPKAILENPDQEFPHKDRYVRIFRDINNGVLTRLAGDIPYIREAYMQALKDGAIIPDVDSKNIKRVDDETLEIPFNNGKITENIVCNKLYNLIGYQHSPETLNAHGICSDEKNSPIYDFDGEFLKATPDETGRTHRGYCGIGAILANPDDPNAAVMPGMIHRMPWLLFNVLMRSYQAYYREKGLGIKGLGNGD